MADNVNPIVGSAELNIRNWQRGLRDMTAGVRATSSYVRQRFSQINTRFADTESATKKLGIGLKDLGRITSGIVVSQVFYRGLNAIRDARDELIKFTFEMERLEQSFTRMFMDRTKANVMMDLLSDLAVRTDLSISGSMNQAKRLQAMGFEAKYVVDIMSVLSDQVAFMGGDIEQMDRIVYALGQIRNSAKVASPEIRQLINALVPAPRYLAEAFEAVTPENVRDIGQIGISGEAAVSAIINGMRRDTDQMAAILSRTSKGLINNIRENVLVVSSRLVAPIRDVWRKAVLKPISEVLDEIGDTARFGGVGAVINKYFSPAMADNIRAVVVGILRGVQAFVRWGRVAGPVMKSSARIIMTSLAIILPAINNLLYGLGTLMEVMVKNVGPIRQLAVAFTLLFVANAVAKSMLFLWGVLRLGTVVSVVAATVLKLGVALRVLAATVRTVIFTSAPLFVFFMKYHALLILVAAAVALAASKLNLFSKESLKASVAVAWLNKMLRKLMFIDTSNILPDESAIKDTEEVQNAIDELTQKYPELTDAQRKAAAEADKASKRMLASFDEVFEIRQAEASEEEDPFNWNTDVIADMLKDLEKLFPLDGEVNIIPSIDEGMLKNVMKIIGGYIGLRLLPALLRLFFRGRKPPKPPDDQGGGRGPGGGAPHWDAEAAYRETQRVTENGLNGVWRRTREGWGQVTAATVAALSELGVIVATGMSRVVLSIQNGYSKAATYASSSLAKIRDSIRAIPTNVVINVAVAAVGVVAALLAIKYAAVAIPALVTIAVVMLAAPGIVSALNEISNAALGIPSEVNLKVNADATAAKNELNSVKGLLESITKQKLSTANATVQSVPAEVAKETVKVVKDEVKTNTAAVSDFLDQQMQFFRQSIPVDNMSYGASTTPVEPTYSDSFMTKQYKQFIDGFTTLIDAGKREEAFKLIDTYGTEYEKVMARVYALGAAGSLAGIFAAGGVYAAPALGASAAAGGTTAAGGGFMKFLESMTNLKAIPGFARGGIITRDGLFRAGEGNKKEAVIPLERTGVIREFARSIAEEMGIGQQKVTHYHVGTLVADDRGLVEFERRLNAIRLDEDVRGGA